MGKISKHSGNEWSLRSLQGKVLPRRDTMAEGGLSRLWDLIFTLLWEDILEGIILVHWRENRLQGIKNLPKKTQC